MVCSPIIKIPAAYLSSSEEATEDFNSTTSTWGSCWDKSSVAAAPCLVSKIFVSIFVPRVWEEYRSTLAELPVPVQGYILWDIAWFPRGSLKDTSPMCHSPLQHRLKQATHNALGLGIWSTVSYLFIDRPATRTGPRLSPADMPRSHSSLGSAVP